MITLSFFCILFIILVATFYWLGYRHGQEDGYKKGHATAELIRPPPVTKGDYK